MHAKPLALTILILAMVLHPGSALAQEGFPEVGAIAVAVYDSDLDHVLWGKNLHQRRSIASLTKIMTLLYTVELVQAGTIALEDQVTASANAASRGGTQIRLKAGDTFSVDELLFATALASANDAAVALAEYVAGSEAAFARLISERAAELGVTGSNFVDASGLLSHYAGNYSTAYDMAVLSTRAMENPLFRKYVSTKEYYLQPQDRIIRNTNALLHRVFGVDGIKTGATTPAGHTLITSGVRDGRRLTIVVLGARTRDARNQQSEDLFEWVFSHLETLIPKGEVMGLVTVSGGATHLINAVTGTDITLFMLDDVDGEIEHRVEIQEGLQAPVERGDYLGDLVISTGQGDLGRFPLVADRATGLASFLRRFWDRLVGLLGLVF